MELHEALTQISEIRLQLARTETFRGYRAVPVAFTGLVALAGGGVQAFWISDPLRDSTAYLSLWVGLAVIGLLATMGEMWVRCGRSSLPLRRELSWLAIEQFLPCVLAGGLVTGVIALSAREELWMLPGLWAVLFSLGLFSSCRLRPRPVFWVALFYLLAGGVSLAAGESAACAPWMMAVPFGVGQLASAAILHCNREETHGA